MIVKCKKCGAEILTDDRFCTKCGAENKASDLRESNGKSEPGHGSQSTERIISTDSVNISQQTTSGDSGDSSGPKSDQLSTGKIISSGPVTIHQTTTTVEGPRKIKCDLCGSFQEEANSFECKRCGRIACKRHMDVTHLVCEDCAAILISEKACDEKTDLTLDQSLLTDKQPAGLLQFKDGRRIFLLAGDVLGFGRDKRSKNPRMDITFRLLPLRSKELDPENWKRSMMISHCHGFFGFRNGGMYIQNSSRNGIYHVLGDLDNRSMNGSIDDLAGTLNEEDETTDQSTKQCELQFLNPGEWVRLVSVSTISLGRTGLLHLKTRIFWDRGKIISMLVERLSNWPQHSYVQVIEKALIGNSDKSAVRLLDPAIRGEPAYIVYRDGLFRLISTGSITPLSVNGGSIHPGREVPLQDGFEITIGNSNLSFRYANDDDFVRV